MFLLYTENGISLKTPSIQITSYRDATGHILRYVIITNEKIQSLRDMAKASRNDIRIM